MENQVRIVHPSPINPSPLVAGNPRMAAAAVDAFFYLLNLDDLLEIEYYLAYQLKQELTNLEQISLNEIWWFYRRHEKTMKTIEEQMKQEDGGVNFQTESFI